MYTGGKLPDNFTCKLFFEILKKILKLIYVFNNDRFILVFDTTE